LKGRKTGTPREAFAYLETVPLEMLAFIQAAYSQPKALGKIKNFLHKWKPLRQTLPVAELEMLGVARGPHFDKIIEEFFQLQLQGRARNPQDRVPALRKLAGIKEPKKPKPPKEEPPTKGKAGKKEKAKEAVAAETKAAPAARPELSRGAPPTKPTAPVKPGKAESAKQPDKPASAPARKPAKPSPKKKPAPKKKSPPKKKKRR